MKYNGGCHCGAVRFEVDADLESGKNFTCNCSHCTMKGWALTFVPAAQFTLLSEQDNLQEYRFNTKHIRHLFCKTCGVESFARGTDRDSNETAATNLHCLDGVDLDHPTVTQFNEMICNGRRFHLFGSRDTAAKT